MIHLRDTAVFCRMLTSRLNLPMALISGNMKLRGDLRLFLRMNTLFSVDARPPVAAKVEKLIRSPTLNGETVQIENEKERAVAQQQGSELS